MKTCMQCGHFQGRAAPIECTAPQNFNVPDYVGDQALTGRSKWQTAVACRKDTASCGPDAAWFEEKPA
jgi:hypothetical protein